MAGMIGAIVLKVFFRHADDETSGMFAESQDISCDPLFAFLMTYNAVKGNYVKEEGSFGYEIEFPYLYVSS